MQVDRTMIWLLWLMHPCSGVPKFWRYRWSPPSHEQEEPASRFPFV